MADHERHHEQCSASRPRWAICGCPPGWPQPLFTRAQLAARLTQQKLLDAYQAATRASWPPNNVQAAVTASMDAMRQSLLDTLTGEGE